VRARSSAILASPAIILAGLALLLLSVGEERADRKKCVLVIGIDGLRSDALRVAHTPHLDALIATGVVSYDAFAGGIRGTAKEQITSSGPGWASILTGVWTDKHRVRDNGFSGNRLDQFPHFFKFIKEACPEAVVASFIDWEEIDTRIVAPVAEYFDYRFPDGKPLPSSYVQRDKLVLAEVEQFMETNDPDALFVYFGNVDIAGHGSGFSPGNSQYIAAAETTDEQIGKVLEAIRKRPQFADEDWMTIVSTDHGGLGTSHGGQSRDERTIFMIVSGGGVKQRVISPGPGHVAVPPTAMRHLGLPVDPSWGWEAEPFGFPPYCPGGFSAKADARFGEVSLAWSPAEGYDLDGKEILRDGEVIAKLEPDVSSFTDYPPVDLESEVEQEFEYSLRVSGTDAAACEPLTAKAAFYNGPIDNELAMHLRLEGDLQDHLGTGAGRAEGAATFSRDNDRQYLELQSDGLVKLGKPDSLMFSRDTDFTVALLCKAGVKPGTVGTIFGNRPLEDGSTRGWALGATRAGNLKWELADGVDGVRFQTVSAPLLDGRWHHIAATHDRDGAAAVYIDGAQVSSEGIGVIDLVDARTEVQIGGRLIGSVDEVMVWRRRLMPAEIGSLARETTVIHPPFFDAVADLRFDGNPGDASNSGNDAMLAGAASFDGEGIRSDAVTLLNDGDGPPSYLFLSGHSDFNFGASQDFTVSVWVKSDGAFGLGGTKSDPAIVSNKNWSSGQGKGWIFAAGKDGRWQWNMGDGDNAHRADYDGPAGEISDGIWHHLLVTHDRDHEALIYYDGQQVARRNIAEIGDINSGLPVGIGTDGAFGAEWPAWFNGSIDNVQIWRRTLSSAEVAFVFDHFAVGGQPGERPPPTGRIQRAGNYAHFSYERRVGGMGATAVDYTASGIRYEVQQSIDLKAGNWESLSFDHDVVGLPRDNGDGTETISIRVPVITSGRMQRFLRLRTVTD
jgi:hypothetical protein